MESEPRDRVPIPDDQTDPDYTELVQKAIGKDAVKLAASEKVISTEKEIDNIEQAFLQDIKEHPDDDAPRLIYADWLFDQGGQENEDRARLIHLETEFPKIATDDPLFLSKLKEINKLKDKVDLEFKEKYNGVEGVGGAWGLSKNIYPSSIKITEFIGQAEDMLRENPLIDALYLDNKNQSVLPELVNCPFLKDIKEMHLESCNFESIQLVLNCPYLSNLRVLSLEGSWIGSTGLQTLLSYPLKMSNLDQFDLSKTGLITEDIQILINSSNSLNLKYLNLKGNNIDEVGQENLRQNFPNTEITF
ncbi:MAG: hypothetical protein A2908_02510 [Candidatus Staskawiczbacteria bacterium RIFCSPLOWO2_01_FULL_38_12b]|uniref:Uncharacterized protein n=1 Tax=Candidatus Staskawiczbacteria bacterium RIFCSPLOWO2_01_FULL_38_12b TaxID=1802214 RepID=A0A1G2IBI9_9BACT|nr:MAG: hypothetical protein A2908_02510 [Candidatus Staskawiczbacteria bacterium RIFCSPLOWO2_01_FULL_38_12b]